MVDSAAFMYLTVMEMDHNIKKVFTQMTKIFVTRL